jgi:hypothetical protein
VADFVFDVLRMEQVRTQRDVVDAKLREALESGDAVEMTQQDWQDVREEGARRATGRRKTG